MINGEMVKCKINSPGGWARSLISRHSSHKTTINFTAFTELKIQ